MYGGVRVCAASGTSVFCLLPKGWVRSGQDLQIILRALAVGGVGEWKSWCLVVTGGWVDGWRDVQFWGEEVKCARGCERGAVAGSFWGTEIWS